MPGGAYVNHYCCRVDYMSPAMGGTLGQGWQGPGPPSVFYCRGMGMPGGAYVNHYCCRVDKASPAVGGILGQG